MTGIYKIQSILKPERFYIGSAINIQARWNRHKRDLLNKKHHSIFLQRHINKYGLEDLNFFIIEQCNKENLLIKEQFYFDNLICFFNNAKIAGSCIGSTRTKEQRLKISEYTKGKNNPTYGLERTVEWRNKISRANKGQKAWNKGKINIYDKETLEKIKKFCIK